MVFGIGERACKHLAVLGTPTQGSHVNPRSILLYTGVLFERSDEAFVILFNDKFCVGVCCEGKLARRHSLAHLLGKFVWAHRWWPLCLHISSHGRETRAVAQLVHVPQTLVVFGKATYVELEITPSTLRKQPRVRVRLTRRQGIGNRKHGDVRMAVPLIDAPEAATESLFLSFAPWSLRQRNEVPHHTDRRMLPCIAPNFIVDRHEHRLDKRKRFAEGIGVSSVEPAVRECEDRQEVAGGRLAEPPDIGAGDPRDLRQLLAPRHDAAPVGKLYEVVHVDQSAVVEQPFDRLAAVLHPQLLAGKGGVRDALRDAVRGFCGAGRLHQLLRGLQGV
mmetsp:Transcript_120119/g.351043  ORF Transcript_120119/g.351043 Transcript_120119/m.351043 type:complete len:333 (-) Transcript_120119:305-1303(-)